MKLTIKTLQQLTFKIDIEPDKTVQELKERIEKEQGQDFPRAAQKLIYNGKILSDENKLSEYEFDEKKFVVLMITRPPPAPKPSGTSTASTAETKPSLSKAVTDEKPKTLSSNTGSITSATTTATAQATQQARTGTSSSEIRPAQPRQVAPSTGPQPALDEALSMGEPQLTARLASLMAQPHFRQIQELIQQSPHLLSSTIESLAVTDPEMYNFMSENPDIFVSAINHPPLAGGRTSGTSSAQSRNQQQSRGNTGGSHQVAGQDASHPQPVVDQILGNVSEHDKEAIERLKELGFSEYLAIQAYMACDRDEQMAANLLFQMEQ